MKICLARESKELFTSQLHLPSKIMEWMHLEDMPRYVDVREVITDNRSGFTKGKSCLNKLVAFFSHLSFPSLNLCDWGVTWDFRSVFCWLFFCFCIQLSWTQRCQREVSGSNANVTSDVHMSTCTSISAALVLRMSWYIIAAANLSWEVLLPLLSPWVPYTIRLLSAGTKYLISCDIQ